MGRDRSRRSNRRCHVRTKPTGLLLLPSRIGNNDRLLCTHVYTLLSLFVSEQPMSAAITGDRLAVRQSDERSLLPGKGEDKMELYELKLPSQIRI